MRVAVYDPYWDTLGGGERYTATVVELCLEQGHQVDIWWPEDISGQIWKKFGIDIQKAAFIQRKPSYQYDLLFWNSDGSLPTSLARKTIIHFQFPFSGVSGKSIKNLIKSRFYVFVANSGFTKRFVDREYGINSLVIYPPVPVEEIKPSKKENIILYVGRFSNLTQQKGHQFLVDRFKKLSPQLSWWRLVLAGGVGVGTDSAYFAQLQNSARGQPIEIILNPSWEEVKKLYSGAKVFLSATGFGFDENKEPIKMEHFGMTLVEAMAGGCVPVVTALGGHKEIVDHNQTGFLWRTPEEMEQNLIRLTQEPKLWQKLSTGAIKSSLRFSTGVFRDKFSRLL